MIAAAWLLVAALSGAPVAARNDPAPPAPRSDPLPAAPPAAPPEKVGLEEVLRLVRERSPRSDAERARIDIAAAEKVAAGVLPNPALDVSSTRLTSGTNTGAAEERVVVLGQPLLIFGQRRERRRTADLGVAAAEAETGAALAERSRRARSGFVDLLAAQERVRILDEERGDLEGIARIVTGRAEAGDKSAYDALRIDLELRARESELASACAAVQETSGALALEVGIPGWHPQAAGDLEPDAVEPADEETLWEQAREHLPALAAAKREQEAARAGIDLARKERLPVPVLSAGGQFTDDASSDSFIAGLSLGLPVLDRGQGAIARATARAGAADLEMAALSAEARADLDRALSVLRERRDALARIDRDVMGRLPDLRRMSEDAYREGSSDILDLLDASRTRAAARQARLEAAAGVAQAEVDLLALTGRVDSVTRLAPAGASAAPATASAAH